MKKLDLNNQPIVCYQGLEKPDQTCDKNEDRLQTAIKCIIFKIVKLYLKHNKILSAAFKLDVIEGCVVDDNPSLGSLECADTTDPSLVVAIVAKTSPIALIVTCSRNCVAVGAREFDAKR